MKSFLRLTVLITLIMIFCGSILHARGGIMGSISLDGVGKSGITLQVLVWMNGSPVPIVATTTTTDGNGNFAVWLLPAEWPGAVFNKIAVKGTIPICSHGGYNFTTPQVNYSDTSVEAMDYNYTTTNGGTLVCNICKISIKPNY